MKQPLEVTGITMQVRVSDMDVGQAWYTALLGRPPDAEPGDDAREWEILPNCWLYIALGAPAADGGALHLGVGDVVAERERLQEALGISISEVERIEGQVAWCEIEDPFGNRLGLFEDLADSTNLACALMAAETGRSRRLCLPRPDLAGTARSSSSRRASRPIEQQKACRCSERVAESRADRQNYLPTGCWGVRRTPLQA